MKYIDGKIVCERGELDSFKLKGWQVSIHDIRNGYLNFIGVSYNNLIVGFSCYLHNLEPRISIEKEYSCEDQEMIIDSQEKLDAFIVLIDSINTLANI